MDWPQKLETDLLTPETRRRQRNLEIITVASLLVVWLRLVPTRVSTLGIDLEKQHQHGVLVALMIFVCGFLAAYVVFALSDLAQARTILRESEAESRKLLGDATDRIEWIRTLVNGQRQPEPQHTIESEVIGQMHEMARQAIRKRNATLVMRFGWLPVVLDFVVPMALAGAAIVSLAIRLW